MTRPKIHLIAPAGSCWPFLEALRLRSAAELLGIAQDAIGHQFEVTGDEELIEAREVEQSGGRVDDAHRAADLERALAADQVVAIVLIRGARGLHGLFRLSTSQFLTGATARSPCLDSVSSPRLSISLRRMTMVWASMTWGRLFLPTG